MDHVPLFRHHLDVYQQRNVLARIFPVPARKLGAGGRPANDKLPLCGRHEPKKSDKRPKHKFELRDLGRHH